MAVIKVSLKGWAGYDSPLLTVEGETAAEVGEALRALSSEGAFGDIKSLAQQFLKTPETQDAVAVVQQTFPKAEVISEEAAPAADKPEHIIQQNLPPCEVCQAPSWFDSGVGANGKWSAYKCSTGDSSHTRWL